MRLRILNDDYWEIRGMGETEVYLLHKIPEAADTKGSEPARKRLYPESSISDGGGEGESSLSDWSELVHPELKGAFGAAIEQVVADLKAVKPSGEKAAPGYHLRIPSAHADHWFSALNQARLVLAERYDLPMPDEEFESERTAVDARWLANAQSNLYAFIQTFLLDTIMKLP